MAYCYTGDDNVYQAVTLINNGCGICATRYHEDTAKLVPHLMTEHNTYSISINCEHEEWKLIEPGAMFPRISNILNNIFRNKKSWI